ncbi:MAG: HNH endonuclease [Candidatus Pristimantibacillus lignocellulolyticus]|uniref:HNH endonuclease n=1 Tax=Candidatus Pristimantibacillus lignocellulolyticus TaxID=2994561 RepID=A0A9J6Z9I8_9BACL|nr:MAG: HNH endonuclease [Candidatus Pristimantibacillus lignocellulolyticus]
MTYLIKRLQHQELGSVNGPNDNPSRGRYLFMSKNSDFLSFLPFLSQTILNDYRILTLIPLYRERFERNYCTFVYNNDRYHEGGNGGQPRDEYRLYSNRFLEGNEWLFRRDDIIVLKPQTIQLNDNGETVDETVYFAYLENDHTSHLYNRLSNEIDYSSIRGNYAVLHEDIEIIEDRILEIMQTRPDYINGNEVNELGLIQVSNDIVTRNNISQTNIDSLFSNQVMFRDFVSVGYENLCAITRQVINCGTFNNLQAAHIYPRSHGGSFNPNNGILMNRDLHWAFDTGCFTINDNYTIRVHPNVGSEMLQDLNGQRIFVPVQEFFSPSINSLHYHQQNIFGGFLDRGRI